MKLFFSWRGKIDLRTGRVLTAISAVLMSCALAATASAQSNSGSHSQFQPPIPDELSKARFEELLKPGALPELQVGEKTAPIIIVGYTSVSCGLCGHFERKILPQLTSKYIEPGVVRLVVRTFPLDRIAAAGAMLTRCVKPEDNYKFHSELLKRQADWLTQKGEDLRGGLVKIFKEFGGTAKEFDACLGQQEILQKVMRVRNRAHGSFGVIETPTFFINGKPLVNPRSMDDFEKIVRTMLKTQ
ncbi:MAG: thioredoxin domain-containing protein [Pseudomonadota bacterium]